MAASRARLEALTLLARRELSEAQLRERLARRGHAAPAIDEAIAGLRADGTLDDARVAEAIARAESTRRGRGRRRVAEALQRAGIARDTAARAADEAFAGIDEDAHLQAAIDKRLRGGPIHDAAEFRRLYRALIGQGFESGRIVAALRARQRS